MRKHAPSSSCIKHLGYFDEGTTSGDVRVEEYQIFGQTSGVCTHSLKGSPVRKGRGKQAQTLIALSLSIFMCLLSTAPKGVHH